MLFRSKPTAERDNCDDEQYGSAISAEALLPDPNGKGELARGAAAKRARLSNGKPKGARHEAPARGTRLHVARFNNGLEQEILHNAIAESMWAGADSEGRQRALLGQIAGCRLDGTADEGMPAKGSSNWHKRKTTKGCELLCTWKGKSQDWVPLKDIKECYPVQIAEFAKAHGLLKKPVFSWWCNHVLKTRKAIIKKVKSRYWKMARKLGAGAPKAAGEAEATGTKRGRQAGGWISMPCIIACTCGRQASPRRLP